MSKVEWRDWVEASLEQWDDQRLLDRDDLRALIWMSNYTPSILSEVNASFRGFSYRYEGFMPLLVVKATINDVKVVQFINGREFTETWRMFFQRVERGELEWREDRFG
jgi:hypothetical protein